MDLTLHPIFLPGTLLSVLVQGTAGYIAVRGTTAVVLHGERCGRLQQYQVPQACTSIGSLVRVCIRTSCIVCESPSTKSSPRLAAPLFDQDVRRQHFDPLTGID